MAKSIRRARCRVAESIQEETLCDCIRVSLPATSGRQMRLINNNAGDGFRDLVSWYEFSSLLFSSRTDLTYTHHVAGAGRDLGRNWVTCVLAMISICSGPQLRCGLSGHSGYRDTCWSFANSEMRAIVPDKTPSIVKCVFGFVNYGRYKLRAKRQMTEKIRW